MPINDLDAIDRNILDTLQEDARMANADLARKVNLSPSPCLRRVRNLEREGYIRHYTALLDPAAIGLPVSVFVQVSLERQVDNALEEFERRIVDLGIVREGDDGGTPVGCGAAENVIGPFGRDLDTGKTFAIGKGAARVDHSHAIAGERGDLRQRLGDVYRADDKETQRRIVNLDEILLAAVFDRFAAVIGERGARLGENFLR